MSLLKHVRAAFTVHPASVGESYWQHARHSAQFGIAMLHGAGAAFIHAVFPSLCTTTGSRIIARLHGRMILNRTRLKVRAQSSHARESHLAENI
jgi:Family of unknown function (DUF6356)